MIYINYRRTREALVLFLLVAGLVAAATGIILAISAASAAKAASGEVAKTLASTRGVLDETHALVKDAKDSLDDNYYDMKATMETVATTAKDADDLVHDLRAALTGGRDTEGKVREGLLTEASALVGDARGLTQSLTNDANDLTAETGAALAPLADSLRNLAALEADLDEQIKQGSPKAMATIDALTKAIGDTDKLIADPAVTRMLQDGATTGDHIAHSAESVDIALMPLRKKLSLLKQVVEKAAGLVKIVIPL